MAGRPYLLSETTWKTVREARYEVAILPWGATEAHNYHLPYGTDVFESEAVAASAAERAWKRGARVVVLPCVPFGVNTGQLDIPLCINMNPSTQARVLEDVIEVVERSTVKKLVILNGHGGNDFKQMIRELQARTKLFLCTVNWYQVVDTKGFFAEAGDHAGEMETSLCMHLVPALVLPLSEAGDGTSNKSKLAAIREGWAWAPRQWSKISKDTGVGNPGQSSAEKGKKYFAAVSDKIATFLIELAQADAASMYESK